MSPALLAPGRGEKAVCAVHDIVRPLNRGGGVPACSGVPFSGGAGAAG